MRARPYRGYVPEVRDGCGMGWDGMGVVDGENFAALTWEDDSVGAAVDTLFQVEPMVQLLNRSVDHL